MQEIGTFMVSHWELFGALSIILFLLARTWFGPGVVSMLMPTEAIQMINHKDAMVVDVRTDKEYQQGHVMNALHIPLGTLDNRISELQAYKAGAVIMVCRSGARSGQAAGKLKKLGFADVHNLGGGMLAWERASLPVTTKVGTPPKPRPVEDDNDQDGSHEDGSVSEDSRSATASSDSAPDDNAPKQMTDERSSDLDVSSESTGNADEHSEEEKGKGSMSNTNEQNSGMPILPKVVMYTAAFCGYCAGAKNLLGKKGIEFTEIRIDKEAGKREEMEQRAQRDSVPQIFIGERHVGGFDDLVDLDMDDELDPLLGLST